MAWILERRAEDSTDASGTGGWLYACGTIRLRWTVRLFRSEAFAARDTRDTRDTWWSTELQSWRGWIWTRKLIWFNGSIIWIICLISFLWFHSDLCLTWFWTQSHPSKQGWHNMYVSILFILFYIYIWIFLLLGIVMPGSDRLCNIILYSCSQCFLLFSLSLPTKFKDH